MWRSTLARPLATQLNWICFRSLAESWSQTNYHKNKIMLNKYRGFWNSVHRKQKSTWTSTTWSKNLVPKPSYQVQYFCCYLYWLQVLEKVSLETHGSPSNTSSSIYEWLNYLWHWRILGIHRYIWKDIKRWSCLEYRKTLMPTSPLTNSA